MYIKLKPLESKNLKSSSTYFGMCELCKKFMHETHYLNIDGVKGYFAHEKCIKNLIKNRSKQNG